ncbi:MAG: hypothetical protein ORO03_05370 [Alphaproteobacteria bacterium]|nr:hypothetical protein [Alphaproteobacteria bacterium]
MIRRTLAIVVVCLSWVGVCGFAGVAFSPVLQAEERNDRPPRVKRAIIKLLHTKYPLWQVGTIDIDLSRECSLGRFNQKVPFQYAGQFFGPHGAAMIGGVKGSGLNLHDPLGQASQGHDYWFYRDRTSACVVYWAAVPPAPAPTEPKTNLN